MKKFKHFVIIKFDYPDEYEFLDVKKQQLRWTCLESLRKQTNTEFVMVFNSSIPMPHEGFGELIVSTTWKDKVRDAAKDYEYVITTRLDGDDFVGPDFIQNIQDNFEESDKMVFVSGGWIYDFKTKRLTNNWMAKSYTTNYISFIEKADNIETCYVRAHGKMKDYYNVKRDAKRTHIWVINEESLRAGLQRDGKYTDKFEDIRDTLFAEGDYFKDIINRVDVFNNKILAAKDEN